MKITTQRKGLVTILLLLVIVAGACKKDKPGAVFPIELTGYWLENVRFDGSVISYKEIHFWGDSVKFTSVDVASYQFTSARGTYSTQGDKLITNFKEVTVHRGGKMISRGPVSGSYLENATYTLNAINLTLNYTTYPADAPMNTTIVFNRFQGD